MMSSCSANRGTVCLNVSTQFVLNLLVRPRQGPFQHHFTQKTFLRTFFLHQTNLFDACQVYLNTKVHQNIIYTSNRRHSTHINKNYNIGLRNVFAVLCRNNRRHSEICMHNKALTFVKATNVGHLVYQLISLCCIN